MTPQASPIRIRRSLKAKRLRLAVKPGLIELVIPRGATEAQAMAFLSRHRSWAENKLKEFDRKAAQFPTPSSFVDASTLPWRGRELPLLIKDSPGARVRVAVNDGAVSISLPGRLKENREEIAKRAFYAWTRQWLRKEAGVLIARHAPMFDLRPREIRVKSMKTRWGSCGPRNDINLNWLLALAPESVLEYVVVHELCHIRERNHSSSFWSLVARHLPDYERERRWLRAHGAELMRRFSL